MSDRVPEWLLQLIRQRQSSVIKDLLRSGGPAPASPILRIAGHPARMPILSSSVKPVVASPSDRYLIGVLSRYRLDQNHLQAARQAAFSLRPLIMRWAGKYYRGTAFSGSFIKGTAVLGVTDLDFFISLAHEHPDTLHDIYESLLNLTRLLSLSPRPQNVSIRIRYQGFSVDLVPAKRQPGSSTYHWLHRRKTGSRTQTNVYRHVSYVRESRRILEIRGTKIWRELHGLEFPSFPLELAVIEALRGSRVGAVAANFCKVLYYLAYVFPGARLVDPANQQNVVSDDLTGAEKQAISRQAKACLAIGDLPSIIW